MGFKSLFITVISAVTIIYFASFARAAQVPWSSEDYTASAWSSFPVPSSDTSSNSSPPVTASAGGMQIDANSSVSDTDMNAYVFLNMTDQSASSQASFTGTYVASAPVFSFIYSLDYMLNEFGQGGTGFGASAWLVVTDETDSITLYNNNSLSLSSNPVTVNTNTSAGHTISVDFGISSSINNEDLMTYGEQSLALNYITAVVPEPVSTILFVTGGTLLAGRRFIKKKAIQVNQGKP